MAILTGTGPVFCAGMDLSVIPKLRAGTADDEYEERLLKEGSVIFDGWLKTYRPTKPVIAAVEGYALAGRHRNPTGHRHPCRCRGRRVPA